MRLRTLTALVVVAVPLLGGCGSTTDDSHDQASHATTATASGTAAASSSPAPASSAPPAPTGPVLQGASFSLLLPASSKPFKGITDWSQGFEHGWNLTAYTFEMPCSCKATNDASGLSQLVKQSVKHDQRDYTDIQRAADVTLGGYRFARVTGGGGPSGQEHIDDYVTYYAGRSLDFQFVIGGSKKRYAKIEAQIAQTLATLQLKR